MVSLSPRSLARFRRDRRGNVGMIFGLALVPLIGAVGCGIDYGRQTLVHTRLNTAADAAALGAISWSSPATIAAQSMTSDGPVPAGVTDATNRFNANANAVANFKLDSVTADVAVKSGYLNSKVSYQAELPTTFMGLFGIKTLYVAGSSTASAGVAVASAGPVYADFHLLLDNSPSMGIAATPAGMSALYGLTASLAEDGPCAFACHMTTSPQPLQTSDTYTVARNNSIRLRIDEVVTAAQQVASLAKGAQKVAGQFRFAVYDYGPDARHTGLTTIFPLSSDLDGAATAAGNISLMTSSWWGDNNDADTPHDTILPAINNVIPTPGDGSSSSSRQQFVFIVSDGVSDEPMPAAGCQKPSDGGVRCNQPINPALCKAFKDRGVQVGVVYTTYFSLLMPNYPKDDDYYARYVASYNPGPYQPSTNSEIAKNMQACASPGLYFETSQTLDIPTALSQLFQRSLLKAGIPRLQF